MISDAQARNAIRTLKSYCDERYCAECTINDFCKYESNVNPRRYALVQDVFGEEMEATDEN